MPDQAEELRKLARLHLKSARVVSVTSGKGGVGKTNLAVNLAVALAARGKSVVLLDFDLGLANADILFDVHPRFNLSHVLSGKAELSAAMANPAPNLRLLPGSSGMEELANLTDASRERLLSMLDDIKRGTDYVVVDTGAGVSSSVMSFAHCADEILVVTTPEPTAMIDAYATIKLISKREDSGNVRLVVNMAANKVEADKVASGMIQVCNRFLGSSAEKFGYILSDPCVPASVRRKKPFVQAFPDSHASRCVMGLADKIIALDAGGTAPRQSGFFSRMARIFGRR